MKRLGFYMTAAALSLGMAGTAAISSQASCQRIVIRGDGFSGENNYSYSQPARSSCGQPQGNSCSQPTRSSCSQPQGNSCQNLQSILSGISAYFPSNSVSVPYSSYNCLINNYGDDEEYFPGQRPGTTAPETNKPNTNKPAEDSKPEQNKPDGNNKPEQNKPDEGSKPGQNNPGGNTNPGQNSSQGSTATDAYVQQVIQLVNEERAKAGLSPLSASSAVSKAADVRAKEIVQNFSHTRPDGTNFSTVLRQNGISFSSSGENIAYGQRSPQEVMNTWMNSSGHRANILNRNFTTIGVGCYQGSNGTLYWTQLFTR